MKAPERTHRSRRLDAIVALTYRVGMRFTSLLGAGLLSTLGLAASPLSVARGQSAAAGAAVVEHGAQPTRVGCAACHMSNGAGHPDVGIPQLAGLTASYIADQLQYFASGARYNAAMSPYAAALTPAQRLEVAAYFAALPLPPAPDLPPTAPALAARGRQIFVNGDERTGLLGCTQCHGPTALGVGDFSPKLAGQSAPYLMSQLQAWYTGQLRDPKDAFMRSVASHLTPADIAAVSAYIAALPDQGTPKP